jgi:S-methylmethionine-dependent homocysteine/selenocysteine methylase
MSSHLPQLERGIFLTDAGLETDLIFNHGIELAEFASFPLVETADGRQVLNAYYQAFVDVARRDDTGVVLETPTWRANPDWGSRLGYSAEQLDRINVASVDLLRALATGNPDVPVVVSGNLGPRGDGYAVDQTMTPDEAAAYHQPQIASFAAAGVDLVTALTMTHVEEAEGIVAAAIAHDVPVVISFTVETDGVLPSGTGLADAISRVDDATEEGPAYYMINCAHPDHFNQVLSDRGPWHRVRGIRANASRASHDELDNATELDRGDETELAEAYVALRAQLPELAVVGGCCGTDIRHVDAISSAFTA